MSIANDWNVDYANKVISHIDGVLTYDGPGSGTQPGVGEYIRGATSGSVGKILAKTGDEQTGTFTLTNVVGRFVDGETLAHMSKLDFDAITAANGGFKVGDTIVGNSSSSTIDVKAIEYNIDGTAGHGTMYGINMSAVFTNNEQLDINGGQSDVADADGTGTDNDAAWTSATVDGSLAVPGTANTNNSVIIHYDAGTIAIPEDAHLADTTGPSGAEGYAQKVIGAVATGSIRVVDSDTTGAGWVDNNTLYVHDVVYYDTLVAGKVFSEGDVIKAVAGASPDAVGRVLAVIDDGDNTGKLILAGMSGTWDNDNEIHVKQADDSYVKYGEVEDSQNSYLAVATVNIPDGVRNEQRTDQGGIYAAGSLNIVRSANALYTYAQDLYDELSALDDDPPLDGNVKDQLYTILNDYVVPDLSFRFLEKGSFKDSGNNNIFTNIQTTGAIADIGNHGYFYDSTNPTPQPDMYIEQDGSVIRQDWLEGNLDVLLKVKTSTDPTYINPSVEALGQLINSAAFTVHVRPYRRTYDSNEVTQQGGIAVVALGNAADLNNTTGQYDAAFSSGSGTPFTVGEEITTTDGKRGVIVTSDSGATGNITYVLKSATNFVNTDSITGAVSGATATLANPTNVVAGYGSDIRVMTVNSRFTGGTTTGTFIIGEQVNQAGGGAYIGYVLEDDSGTIYTEDVSGTRANSQVLTGQTSSATNTPTGNADFTTVPKDIGGGVGDKNYTAVVSADITDASPQAVAKVYEWWKFLLRKESTLTQGGPGSTAGVEGRIFRKLQDTFAEVRGASPYGTKAGALVIGAQGVFIDKDTLASADLRNIQLIDNLGGTYDPPNLQVLEIINLITGTRAAAYRSTGAGNEDIMRDEFYVGSVGTHNQSGDSTILVKDGGQGRGVSPLPNDVPDTGVLRVLDPNDTGDYLRFPYASVDRATNVFTLASGTIGDVTGSQDLVENDNAHVVLVEEEASGTSVNNTIQFVSNINLFVRARKIGKKPFKTTGTFSATGASIGAVLSNDDVVNLP